MDRKQEQRFGLTHEKPQDKRSLTIRTWSTITVKPPQLELELERFLLERAGLQGFTLEYGQRRQQDKRHCQTEEQA